MSRKPCSAAAIEHAPEENCPYTNKRYIGNGTTRNKATSVKNQPVETYPRMALGARQILTPSSQLTTRADRGIQVDFGSLAPGRWNGVGLTR